MNCQEIKPLIPQYIEGDLQTDVYQQVTDHLSSCKACQKEVSAAQQSWEMLGELEDIEPSANYISRFWTTVSTESPWHEKLLVGIKGLISNKRFAPALVTACLLIIVGTISLNTANRSDVQLLAELSEEEVSVVKDAELAGDLDMIEDLEFYETLVELEDLDLEILDIEESLSDGRPQNEKKTLAYYSGPAFAGTTGIS